MTTSFKPGEGTLGTIKAESDSDIEVGPLENIGYGYRIGAYFSQHMYANAASARHAARKVQRITWGKLIEPVPESEAH